MAVIDIRDENLTKEQEELETLRNTLEEKISAIDEQLTVLKKYWQDENSEKWLTDQNTLMSELKTQNKDTATKTNEYFGEIIETLKVYANE